MTEREKVRRRGISYTLALILMVVIIALAGFSAYSGYLLHSENVRLHADIDRLYETANMTLAAWNQGIAELGGNANIVISPPSKESQENVTNLETALSLMQGQFNTYQTSISTLLTVFLAGLTLFNIVIPLFNYIFFQKEHIEKINQKFEDIKDSIEKISGNVDVEIERLHLSIEQNQQVVETITDDDTITDIMPISHAVEDMAFSYYLNGKILHSKKRYVEAQSEKQKAVELNPDIARYHDSLGVTLHAMKKYEEAEIEKRQAVELDPNAAQYHYSLGVTLHAMKKYEEAEAESRKAVQLKPDNARYHNSLGVTLHAMKKYKEAEDEKKKTVELEPDNVFYIGNYGITLFKRKRYINAISHLNLAVNVDEISDRAHLFKGLSRIMLNKKNGITDYQEALADMLKSISINPDDSRNYRDCAWGYIQLDMLEEAENFLKKAEEMDEDDPEIHYNYYLLYKKRGDNGRADEYYAKAKTLGYIDEPE